METKSVDVNFEKALNEDLPDIKKRVKIDGEENSEEENNEDPSLLKPISNYTKNLIACKFAGALNQDPVATSKMMGLLKQLESMTEAEGRIFLSSIETADISMMSDFSVTFMLRYLSKYFVNPNNKEAQEHILQDRFVRSALSHKMTEAFCSLGSWAGAFLFIIYAVESWSTNNITEHINTKEDNHKIDAKNPN